MWAWPTSNRRATPTGTGSAADDERAVRHQGLRRGDLDVAVRSQGGDSIAETSLVVLEPGGTLVVELKQGDQVADKADIAQLRAELARLERKLG
ncbi:hypothetical protein ACQB60_22320 [Actinomycetota bacterium Odt1-20B]